MELICKIAAFVLSIVIILFGCFMVYIIASLIVFFIGGFYDDATGGSDFLFWFLNQ